MTSLTITIPLPPKAVKPNSRKGWRRKAEGTQVYRKQAWAAAFVAVKRKPPMWKKARVNVAAYFKTTTFPDPDNLIASLKAAFDGVADAGVIQNDRDLWPERPQMFKDASNPRIELTITEET
ncbi:RusA family crossover junction endodeoxyribonuclease [Prosthecobacter sp.]|jgi:Holliday junction resolvase RusA-like endonuclease|uniref:RusA family crossover junction endodeoxyribonuclease n=1 Tax=Prosthecobacter sp. TaxID=1965333 RepID=UPI0037C87DBF